MGSAAGDRDWDIRLALSSRIGWSADVQGNRYGWRLNTKEEITQAIRFQVGEARETILRNTTHQLTFSPHCRTFLPGGKYRIGQGLRQFGLAICIVAKSVGFGEVVHQGLSSRAELILSITDEWFQVPNRSPVLYPFLRIDEIPEPCGIGVAVQEQAFEGKLFFFGTTDHPDLSSWAGPIRKVFYASNSLSTNF
jgi:hypothetical protein